MQSPQESQSTGTGLQGPHPDLVRQLAPQLRVTQAGLVAAVLAAVLCVAALAGFPDLASSPPGSGWTMAATLAAVLLLATCTFQLLAWRRALAEWDGSGSFELAPLRRTSWLAHLVSYAVVLFGLWSGIAASVMVGTSTLSAGLLAFALLLMLIAQALAAANYLRTEGPPGTVPGHVRRLNARIQQLR